MLKPLHRLNSKKSLFNQDSSTILRVGELWPLFNQDLTDWLIKYVGQRGRDWDFGNPTPDNMAMLSIAFKQSDHAVLFALRWLSGRTS